MPFTGGGPWTIAKKIMQDQPAVPSSINTSVTPLFDAVVNKALTKDPAQRYQSARDLGIAVKRALGGKADLDETERTVVQNVARPTKPAPASRSASAGRGSSSEDADIEFWRSIKDGNDSHGFELYIEQFPEGIYAKLARHKISMLGGTGADNRVDVSRAHEELPRHQEDAVLVESRSSHAIAADERIECEPASIKRFGEATDLAETRRSEAENESLLNKPAVMLVGLAVTVIFLIAVVLVATAR